MKYKASNFFTLFLLILCISSCTTYRSTTYARIPKSIRKQIERNYDNSNVFFYQAFDNTNTFLYWYYEQSTVNWFSYIKGKLADKGTFESNNGTHGFSIFKTNKVLKAELDKFEETCFAVLDGELFGYVMKIKPEPEQMSLSVELVVLTSISSTECFVNAKTDNFIANDFKRIRDLNYQFLPITND